MQSLEMWSFSLKFFTSWACEWVYPLKIKNHVRYHFLYDQKLLTYSSLKYTDNTLLRGEKKKNFFFGRQSSISLKHPYSLISIQG